MHKHKKVDKKRWYMIDILIVFFSVVFFIASIIANILLYLERDNSHFIIILYSIIAIDLLLFACLDIYTCKKYREKISEKSLRDKKGIQIIKIVFFIWMLISTFITFIVSQFEIKNNVLIFHMACLTFLVSSDRIVSNIDKYFELKKAYTYK